MTDKIAKIIPIYSKAGSPLSNFSVTLLKALPITYAGGIKIQPKYQKIDYKSQTTYPFFHTSKLFRPNNFYELYTLYEKLLTVPSIGQVFGVLKREYAESNLKIRRSKEYLTYLNKNSIPILYNYIVLEYDDKKGETLLPQFKRKYENKELDKLTLENQTRALLYQIFPFSKNIIEKLPIILRLSSSFFKLTQPSFRAHMILPTEDYTPLAIASILSALSADIDPSIYRSPNQIIFTAKPEFSDNILDPLKENIPGLNRLYFFGSPQLAKDNTTIPRIPINSEIKKVIPEFSKSSSVTHSTYSAKIKPSWEISGDAGLFNLYVHQNIHGKLSIKNWLIDNDYKPTGKNRYVSPTSDSGSAGLILIKGGYLYDHHQNSPIKDIIPYPERILSAYDLYLNQYMQEGRLADFKKIIIRIRATDPEFKKKEYLALKDIMSFIHSELSKKELEEMVSSLIRQIFESRLDSRYKDALFREIVERTKKSEFPYKTKDLKRLWTELVNDLAGEIGHIDPKNNDDINANSLLKQIIFYYNVKGQYYIIKHPVKPLLEIPDIDTVKTYIGYYLTELSVSTGWSNAKMTANINKVLLHGKYKSMNKPEEIPELTPHLYLFKNSYEVLNIYTKKILPLSENLIVLNELPFTKKQYLDQLKTPHPAWLKFIRSSLPNKYDRILLRYVLAYLISPLRKEQKILFLYGVGRSGKSTIKNLYSALFPGLGVEVSVKRLMDNFSLADFNPFTKIFVINEFNKEGNTISEITAGVNVVKEISGRDTIKVRGMRENYKKFVSDALPILISNRLPLMPDKAFQNRLMPINFRHAFPGRSDLKFQQELLKALPTIFLWGLEYFSEDRMTVNFDKVTQTKYFLGGRSEVLKQMDVLGAFCESTLKPANLKSGFRKNKAILRKDLMYYFRRYFEDERGFPYPDETYKQQHFPNISDLRQVFPGLNLENKKIKLKGEKFRTIYGVQWGNKEMMKKALSDF